MPDPAAERDDDAAPSPDEGGAQNTVPETPSADEDIEPRSEPAVELTEADFVPQEPAGAASEPRPRRIGPGLPESIAWIVGAMFLQVVGAFLAVAVVLAFTIAGSAGGTPFTPDELQGPGFVKTLLQDNFGVVLGVVQMVMVAGAVVAAALRLGRERTRLLSLRPVPWRHLAILVVAMLPIGILSMQLYAVGETAWRAVTDRFPAFRAFDELDSMSAIDKVAHNSSLLVLLLLIAVAPAVWEELVFRGVIGRGLVARYGLWNGIALTALIFAAMHFNPPHVFALLPLAVYLHVAYLSTRSFYAPMLVHFLNNGLAVVLLKAMPDVAGAGTESAPFSIPLFAVSALSVAAVGVLLWRSRVQFVGADGTTWDPGYPTAEAPPRDAGYDARCRRAPVALWVLAGTSVALVLATMMLGALLPDSV